MSVEKTMSEGMSNDMSKVYYSLRILQGSLSLKITKKLWSCKSEISWLNCCTQRGSNKDNLEMPKV